MDKATDFAEFSALMLTAMKIWKHDISRPVLDMYFGALELYPLQVVREALNAHVRDPAAGQFYPKPSDLIRQITNVSISDGRPGRDEAWSIALRSLDEGDTVLITEEILGSLFAARPLLDVRDKVAARLAFVETYDRIVGINRAKGKPVHWQVSLGDDKQRRQLAVEEGVRLGRLTSEQAAPHLARIGHETQQATADGLAVVALLAGPTYSDRLKQLSADKETLEALQSDSKHEGATPAEGDLRKRWQELRQGLRGGADRVVEAEKVALDELRQELQAKTDARMGVAEQAKG